jgi:hypothetical protein
MPIFDTRIRNWEVLVGNVGSIYTGENGFKARQEYAEARRAWPDEPVTLMKDGHPAIDFDPNAGYFFAEVTDTFSGEANYCWVRRYKIKATTKMGAARKLGKYEGYGLSQAWDDGSTMRYDFKGVCICAFIEGLDPDCHGNYTLTVL